MRNGDTTCLRDGVPVHLFVSPCRHILSHVKKKTYLFRRDGDDGGYGDGGRGRGMAVKQRKIAKIVGFM